MDPRKVKMGYFLSCSSIFNTRRAKAIPIKNSTQRPKNVYRNMNVKLPKKPKNEILLKTNTISKPMDNKAMGK